MTLKEFSDVTIKVIREDGFADYLPTLMFPDTREVRAIQGIPPEVDHREAIQNVVRKSHYDKRELFFGVLSAPERITVGHHRLGQAHQFMEITAIEGSYSASSVGACKWWSVT